MAPQSDREPIDLLIEARWVVPVVPRNQILENHTVAIHAGRILAILPHDEARARFSATEVRSLPDHALLPGLVNAHGHLAMSLFRGMADDLPLMTWLNDHIWPAEGKWISPEFVRDGAELAMAEMLRGGTTCFSDMYFFPETVAEVAEHCGMRAQVCGPILDFPTPWGSGPEEYLEKSRQLAARYREHPLISVALGPHAPYTVSDGPLEQVKALAISEKLPVHIHLHETQFEVDEALQKSGKRPIQRLHELGLISPDIHLQCVHMTALDQNDIQTLQAAHVHVVHCPESNLKLASGFCPVHTLHEAGITIALGTDGAASNNDLDMFGELRTAALLAKAVAQNAAAIDAHTALEMATINGARALGLASRIGSLETGKDADIIAVDLTTLNSQPCYHPVSNLVYSVASNQVTDVWVAGRSQVCQGDLQNFDTRKLIEKAANWSQKIALADKHHD